MKKRRKINLPLIEVIGVSLIVHLILIIGLGSYTIYTALIPDEPEMEAPPPPEKIEPQKLQQQVRLQQQQKKSSRPVQKITVTNISSINLPDLSVSMPTVDTKVAVGGNYGAGRVGDDFGGGGIDFSKSAVDFFGIKSTGERVMFIVDASRYMLEDQKGGLPAYNIIKDEISAMVSKLSSGTLFNAMFYDGSKVQIYSDKLLPATRQNKELFKEWIKPINKDFASVGKLSSNVSIQNKTLEPLTDDASQWLRAVQIAMEQGSDTINILVAGWQHHGRGMTTEERAQYYKDQGWDEKKQAAWDAAVVKAQEWLKNENEKRKKAGQPERVVQWIGTIVRELEPRTARPPSDVYSEEEIDQFLHNLEREYYANQDRSDPPVNVVLFLGADEDEKNNSNARRFEELAKGHHGKFRVLQGMKALQNITGKGSG
ncbi:hypothetical protein H5P28_17550 [Ruficoccus amylovorans]|uniref:VWFA domain-containing protein n=1 Tax=Ruficoccus amylovorans TaxID=1804625 RepID=A0A842HKL5_9BACT|nr:hypothetical protein [Ruficoccus amylovorans]MBC2596076.1 hypothetical protein [Ruficoccus amylovorans]